MFGRPKPQRLLADHVLHLNFQINTLKSELNENRKKIYSLEQQNKNLSVGCPKPDYSGASQYYASSTEEEITDLNRRFRDLYEKNRHVVMGALDELPEFADSEELKAKTVFSVIVLTYRSVHDTVKRDRVWSILDAAEDCNRGELDNALYRHLYNEAQSQHGMDNAKEVTSQIWSVLYDFPSLKTCTCFNRFILDCVDVVWAVVAGINGNQPRLKIEYESYQFDPAKHLRTPNSNPRASVIKRYLWPSLSEPTTGRIHLKAIVVT
ncbi:hypothetical protein L596_003275 [Steinernema carpocapsae]|uniref:Mitochondria-eating protein n=1 Tax=Steinernema carpocapsae TaxID=34508 RepID=A0A4V6I7Z2_STECR|nr:hypothetical protein L596_003275 [Steinernema carpocapsae]